jgi:hypothetical protein
MKILAKIVGIINMFLIFLVGGGMARRVNTFEHSAVFTKNNEEGNELKHFYLAINYLLSDIIRMNDLLD